MNYSTNNKKDNKDNNSRALYITLVAALSVMAILIAVAGIAGRISSSNTSEDENNPSLESDISTKDVNLELKNSDTEKSDNISEKESENTPDTEEANLDDTEAEPVVGPADSIPKYFHVPVNGIVSKEFSNIAAVYSNTMNDYRTHNGVDIACDASAPVMAAADGTVSAIWDDPMNGTSIKITHSGGAVSTYHNLSSDIPDGLAVGSQVRAGDVIATVGETSLLEIADEYHLHYELSINNENVNPCDYITFEGKISYDE